MNEYSVLISGGGIAGPALAHWLHRQGIRSTIVEQAPDLRVGGQAVDLRGLGEVVAERMGIMPSVRERIVHEKGLRYVDSAGHELATMPADLFVGDGSPVTEIEIMKGDLTEILHELVQDHTEIIFGDRITALSDAADGVTVTFRSGLVRTFDIVVGADGIHSGVRFSPSVRNLSSSSTSAPTSATARSPTLDRSTPGSTCTANPAGCWPSGRSGAAQPKPCSRSPTPGSMSTDETSPARSACSTRSSRAWGGDPRSFSQRPMRMTTFTSTPSARSTWTHGLAAGSRCSATPDTAALRSPAWARAWPWSARTCWPGSWAVHAGDHTSAFSGYEEIMRPYVTASHVLPPGGVDGFLPRGRFMLRMRVLTARLMHHWPMRQLVARMLDKSDAIALPEYQWTALTTT